MLGGFLNEVIEIGFRPGIGPSDINAAARRNRDTGGSAVNLAGHMGFVSQPAP